MRTTITIMLAATLGLAACGSGDDSTDDAEPAEQPTSTESSRTTDPDESSGTQDTAATDSDDDAASDDTSAPEATDDAPATTEAVDTTETDSGSIDSFDDIPPRCREVMADFLQDLEPLVGQIDWRTATAQDFEQIAPEFEQFATDFDAEAATEGCDELDMDADVGFEMLIEFANDVAPGTAPFFQFLEGMRSAVAPGGDDTAAPDSGNSDEIETCDQMIDGLRDLMDQYDSFDQMPLSELTKYAGIGTIMMTCTPEQLALLGSDEFEAFLGG